MKERGRRRERERVRDKWEREKKRERILCHPANSILLLLLLGNRIENCSFSRQNAPACLPFRLHLTVRPPACYVCVARIIAASPKRLVTSSAEKNREINPTRKLYSWRRGRSKLQNRD
jgi:hypothetical protein